MVPSPTEPEVLSLDALEGLEIKSVLPKQTVLSLLTFPTEAACRHDQVRYRMRLYRLRPELGVTFSITTLPSGAYQWVAAVREKRQYRRRRGA